MRRPPPRSCLITEKSHATSVLIEVRDSDPGHRKTKGTNDDGASEGTDEELACPWRTSSAASDRA